MGLREKNPGALDKLRAKVRRLNDAGFGRELQQVLAATAVTQVDNCFVEQRDPYGDAWQKLTSRDGEALRNDGHMKASIHPVDKGKNFSVVIDQGHPAVHNRGATIVPRAAAALRFVVRGAVVFAQKVVIPKRQMVPDKRRGLGPIWSRAFAATANDLIRRRLGVT
jgi:phage gpG-like protein